MAKTIFVDGGGENPEGISHIAVVAGDLELAITLHGLTNNEAEYLAALLGIALAEPGDIVCSDSQLVFQQVNKNWKIKAKHLQEIAAVCTRLIDAKSLELKWIRREENEAGKILGKL